MPKTNLMESSNVSYPTGHEGRIHSAFTRFKRADEFAVRSASRKIFDREGKWSCDNDEKSYEDHLEPAADGDGEVAVVCRGCSAETVEFEMYEGRYGHGENTLVKDVTYSTDTCPACGSPGRQLPDGVVCQDDSCGVMISDDQPIVPEDHFNDRTGPDTGFESLNDRGR